MYYPCKQLLWDVAKGVLGFTKVSLAGNREMEWEPKGKEGTAVFLNGHNRAWKGTLQEASCSLQTWPPDKIGRKNSVQREVKVS